VEILITNCVDISHQDIIIRTAYGTFPVTKETKNK